MRKEADGVALDAEQSRAADAGVKAMISVGRPFLDHVISALADAGFTDVCLVIGPEHDIDPRVLRLCAQGTRDDHLRRPGGAATTPP